MRHGPLRFAPRAVFTSSAWFTMIWNSKQSCGWFTRERQRQREQGWRGRDGIRLTHALTCPFSKWLSTVLTNCTRNFLTRLQWRRIGYERPWISVLGAEKISDLPTWFWSGPPEGEIPGRLTQGEKNGYFHVSLIIIYFLIYRTFACFFPFSLSLKFPSASLGTHVRDINARQPPGGFLLLSLIELPIYLSISNVCDRWHRIRSFEQRYIPFMMI